MADLSPEELLAVRAALIEIEFRAKSDQEFAERLMREPLEVLQEFGIDDVAADDMRAEFVAEQVTLRDWCDPITCIFTSCNFYTNNMPPVTVPDS